MQRRTGLVFTAFVVLLAVAVVSTAFGEFSLVVDLAMALLGLAFLAGSVLSLVEVGQRIHQLGRFTFADVYDGRDVASLAPGSHWLRIEADVVAQDGTVHGVLDDGPAVAVTVEGDVRERFVGFPWPSKQVGTRFQRTAAVPAAIDRSVADVTVAAAGTPRTVGHDVRVVGGDRRELTADDDVPPYTRDALVDLDVDVEDDLFSGRLFEHYVRITEATVPNEGTVRLFGPVTVETDGSRTTLTPAGRFASRPLLTTEGWGAVLQRVGRRIGVLSLVVPLAGACGVFLLSLAVTSLHG